MPETPKISLTELRGYISDAGELAKGTQIADGGALLNLARHDNRLFAEAKGSGQSPYRVSLTFGDQVGDLKAHCSCMAARSRPFCKHSAALLVSWARSPESFVVSEAPPVVESSAKKKSVKTGKAESADLMQHGVERVTTLVRELAVAGIAAAGVDRAEQVRQLGEGLRENRLRRLSARTLELSRMIAAASERRGQIDAVAYADLLSDMLLTARKLEKHLGGEALDDRYVEELIGKTWRKADRKSVEGLELVEYAYVSRVTADDYVIRESRFVEIHSGVHYSEKQILPSFMAKRSEAKRSYAGSLLQGVSAGLYPGFAPHRLDFESLPEPTPLAAQHVATLLEQAHTTVSAALAAFQAHRRDVFAPDAFPVCVRTEFLAAEHGRLRAVDAAGEALHLPIDERLEEAIAGVSRRGRLVATIGEMTIEGILATLVPLAFVVDAPDGLDLVSLTGLLIGPAKARHPRGQDAAGNALWLEQARSAGISAAAISLGEVRLELADVLVTGLGSLVTRVTDPLVARLNDLGLEKPAALLADLPGKLDPADRLEGFVKIHQVAGLALVRMAGAMTIATSDFERLPTATSIAIPRPATVLTPEELVAARLAGKLTRHEVAWHRAKQFESTPIDELLAEWPRTWSDGEATPFIARTLASCAERAVQAAAEVLADRLAGRTAQLTALRVLTDVGSDRAVDILKQTAADKKAIPLVRARAAAASQSQARGWRALLSMALTSSKPQSIEEALGELMTAEDIMERSEALRDLEQLGAEDAIPMLKEVWMSDAKAELRARAAIGLALLGDSDSVDMLVSSLRERATAVKEAKAALAALGALGDIRAVPDMLQVLMENWAGPLPGDALRSVGVAALEPTIALALSQPEFAQRKSLQHLVLHMTGSPQTTRIFGKRLQEVLDTSEGADKAAALLKLAAESEPLREALARHILARVTAPSDKAEKALVRSAQQALQKREKSPAPA